MNEHQTKNIAIGYWGFEFDKDHAMPVADTARPDQAEMIAKLKVAMATGYWQQYRGWSNCRLCGKSNGSKELEIIRGNVKYLIPEGYLHYLVDHNVGYDLRLLEVLPNDK
jgi:hypothetical protein